MDSTSAYFIDALIRAVKSEPVQKPPADIDWDRFLRLAQNQGYVCLMADMADAFDGIPRKLKDKLTGQAKLLKTKEKFRNIYLNTLFDSLAERGLYSMPIKGFVIKNLYPKPYMREMNDIDVLIKLEQLDDVRSVLEENGYVYDHTSTHEVVFNLDPFINLEIHTQLISVYHGDMYKIFDDAWDKAVPADDTGFKRRMTPEDLYVHTLTHFAMHYGTAGGGLKPVVDLYLIRRQLKGNSDTDYGYIHERIERLGFSKFDSVISRLGDVWFEGAEHTPETEQTQRLLLINGAYGSIENYTMLRFYRLADDEKNPIMKRIKVLASVMFMKPATLAVKYPGLKNRPFLYPYYTVVRWFEILTKRTGDVKSMARVTFHSEDEGLRDIMNEVIENNKMLGFKKNFFDKKFYD